MKINSKGKKILIFSDPHQEIEKLVKIISHEAADINICLGDWFDSHFRNHIKDYKDTANYLMQYLGSSNNITLFGNHDTQYLSNNKYTICSGYGEDKHEVINRTLGPNKNQIVDKFKWFVWLDDYLCTHAGLHGNFIDPAAENVSDINLFLEKEEKRANIKLKIGDEHWFYMAGRARGGPYPKGGITWLDFDREFAPIEGLSQIVGHTYRKNAQITEWRNTKNYCIDTNLSEWVTITNGKLEIKNYKDL
jgi:hypothetical protein